MTVLRYKETHPDFDNAEAFKQILEHLKQHGFEDMSCKNDTCPCIWRENKDHSSWTIWIDYKNPELREFKEMSEFAVVKKDENDDCVLESEFTTVDELIADLEEAL
jgi:Mg2+ and Co2+ transporter CorA